MKIKLFANINSEHIQYYLDDGRTSGRCTEQIHSCNTSAQKGCADDAM